MKFLEGYNTVAKILHWLMAIMIVSLLAVGFYMSDLPREDDLRPTLYFLHKAFGMTVLFLVFIRIAWRLFNKPPSLDRYTGAVKIAASISHASLYVLMFAIPIAGYLMSSYYGHAVNYFGLFDLPILVEKNEELGELAADAHEILAFVIIAVLVLHIAGALKHRFEKK